MRYLRNISAFSQARRGERAGPEKVQRSRAVRNRSH
jgi:hypothetical protein